MRASFHRTQNTLTRHIMIAVTTLIMATFAILTSQVEMSHASTLPDFSATQVTPSKPSSRAAEAGAAPSPMAKKPHRLIRKPSVQNTQMPPAKEAASTATASNPAIQSVPFQEQGSSQPREGKDAAVSKSNLTGFAVPMSAPVVGQSTLATSAQSTPTPSKFISGAVSSTRMASTAADQAPSSAPASMRRLFAEIPGVAQIMAYEDPDPVVTTPTISRNPATMAFSTIQNGATPAAQTLSVSNAGPGNLNWTVSSNSAWLKINNSVSASGTNSGTVSITAVPSGLAVGTHSGLITIIGAGASNSPQTVTVTLDITAAPTPTIGLSATALSFSAVQGGGNPTSKTVSISNTGTGTLNWTATESSSWLGVSPASGTGAGTLTVSVNTAGMAAGSYSAPITIVATGATNTPQTITVSLTVTTPPAIGVSPTSLTFTATQGGANPTVQALTISNAGGGTFNWAVSDNVAWLSATPTSGTGAGSSSLSVSIAGLAAGTYSGTVTITSTGASNTPRTVPVTLTISATPSPSIGLSPANLSFTAVQGAANPAAKSVSITNTGGGTLSWSISDNAAWLTLGTASGTTTTETDPVTVTVNTSGLTAGSYSAVITITATAGATNTPQTIPVSLTVTAPTTSSATLTWNANTDSDLAGYRIYRATAAGSYGAPLASLPAGTVTYQATGLQAGTTYYFVVTAFDTAGNESTYSNEVQKVAN